MTSYIMYDILKQSVLENLAKEGPLTSFLGGGGRTRMALIRLWVGASHYRFNAERQARKL